MPPTIHAKALRIEVARAHLRTSNQPRWLALDPRLTIPLEELVC